MNYKRTVNSYKNTGFFFNPNNNSLNTQYKATCIVNSHLRDHRDEWENLPSTVTFYNSRGELASRPEWTRSPVAYLSSLFGHVFNSCPFKNGFLHLPQDDLDLKRLRKMLDYVVSNRESCLYREACYDSSVKGVEEWYHNMDINPYWKLVAGCRFIFTLNEQQLNALTWDGVESFNLNIKIERVRNMLPYEDIKKKSCIDVSLYEPKQYTVADLFEDVANKKIK